MALLLLLGLQACNQRFDAEDSRILTDIEERYCPDKRVCIWDIKMNPNGRTMRLSGETDLPKVLQLLEDSLMAQGFLVKDSKVKIYPDTSLGNDRYAIPVPTVLNIRSEPRFSAELATQTLMGWPMILKYRVGSWYKVQTNDGYLGWVESAGVKLMDDDLWQEYRNSKLGVVNTEGKSFLERPGGRVIQDATAGCLVRIMRDTLSNWIKVALPNGLVGWLPNGTVTDYDLYTSQEIRPDLYNSLARTYLGRPYLWGGTSPYAMDCSGFTKMVFHRFGLSFPRDASQQVAVGDTITTDPDLPAVLPGDLLFFGTKQEKGKKDKVSHVAIYLGEGRFIHSSGQVRIQSLRSNDKEFAPERYKTFLVAKRIDYGRLRTLPLSY